MSKMSKTVPMFGCMAVLALSGCVDKARYETTPVQVQTKKGIVTCQLYTERQVLWDEAISVPNGMSIAEGDQVCINEGKRRLNQS